MKSKQKVQVVKTPQSPGGATQRLGCGRCREIQGQSVLCQGAGIAETVGCPCGTTWQEIMVENETAYQHYFKKS